MHTQFSLFFQGLALDNLMRSITLALDEDGADLTAEAVFSSGTAMRADIIAKEETFIAGLPIISLVLHELSHERHRDWTVATYVEEGERLEAGTRVARIEADARLLLKAERVILNFICHLSGIANETHKYVTALEGTGVRLLDTRKTLPGLRYPEKYAVLMGGGGNHRKTLEEMLMLKDNHIDASGGITQAVALLRDNVSPLPPIEVECRNQEEVLEAVACNVDRIMLDNMDAPAMEKALAHIPAAIEVEVSGGVSLTSLGIIAALKGPRKPDFVSVGRITHSAPAADFSMRIAKA